MKSDSKSDNKSDNSNSDLLGTQLSSNLLVQSKVFPRFIDYSQITVGMSSYAGNKLKRVFNTRIISLLSILIKSLKPNSQVPHILARVYNTNTCKSKNTHLDRNIDRFL